MNKQFNPLLKSKLFNLYGKGENLLNIEGTGE